ncbi:Asp23/Gls24 family envelope stress response protein [Gordonibacter sp. An230]|uniref:Asp23/Gls24 family envelope stress response protein n=1 Tax=Gordonibacter sp. An230 TaxID=1965592 RepID=UPI000B38A6CB|nr:Asp23/Gls24 family envelope stress response protein [Gordonibacter sp. An230]OUO90702.1 Asp23/Gls24 family envelope stress response protein [Gordonibacter sp. An230]
MSDTIPGNLHVANDVLADMVGNAALECYGVVGMAAPSAADGIAKILPASRLRRGVVVSATDSGVHVELYVVIEYGTNINTVSQNLIDQVSFALTEYARVPLDGVEVHVQGVKVRK